MHMVLSLILTGFAVAACGTAGGGRVARDLATIQSERAPDRLVALGVAFANVGDLTRAEQYLVAALDEGADADVVLPKLLRVCIAAGHERAAIGYALPELQRRPGEVRLRFVVSELRALTGDTAGARLDLERVVSAQPEAPAPHFAFARLLRDQFGDVVAADREFRAYLRAAPEGEHADEARASILQPVVAAPAAAPEAPQ